MLVLATAALGLAGCARESDARNANPDTPASRLGPGFLKPAPIGRASDGRPWITHVAIADLDRDGRLDVIACEGRLNQVLWLRQVAPLAFEESVLTDTIAAPVHTEALDFDADGDVDLLVASMGVVFPSNEKIGAVVWLEQVSPGRFESRVLLERTDRVTDVRAADLDGDGDLDLAVAQFGYHEGKVAWLENVGGKFEPRTLLGLAGAIHAPIVDLTGDGRPDIAALVSQEWEEIHLFANRGGGAFAPRVIHGSSNEDYGSSGLAAEDVDRDGDTDLLYTNGDAFDYARPGPRPWHGVQWLENDGKGTFAFRRLGTFPGAYSPIAVDLDGDGDRDIVAASGFNHWEKPDAVSLVCFENDGRQNFSACILAQRPTHLVALAGGDLDGDGTVELVTGSFHAYPPFEHTSRLTLWRR